MTKIIEYEVGKYQGHPVVIRFANVSEEDARVVVDAFKKRLSGHLVLDGDIQRTVQAVDVPLPTLTSEQILSLQDTPMCLAEAQEDVTYRPIVWVRI